MESSVKCAWRVRAQIALEIEQHIELVSVCRPIIIIIIICQTRRTAATDTQTHIHHWGSQTHIHSYLHKAWARMIAHVHNSTPRISSCTHAHMQWYVFVFAFVHSMGCTILNGSRTGSWRLYICVCYIALLLMLSSPVFTDKPIAYSMQKHIHLDVRVQLESDHQHHHKHRQTNT